MPAKIKKDDTVVVITGAEKGSRGKVLQISGDRALVEGINLRTKHLRRSSENPEGAIVQIELPIHISNLMPSEKSTGDASSQADEAENDIEESTAEDAASKDDDKS